MNVPRRNPPLTFTLKNLDAAHSSLAEKGIDRETAAAFGIGYCPDPGPLSGRIAVPINNVRGLLVGYAGIALDTAGEPRCMFLPSDFEPSAEVFNLGNACATGRRRVVVVQDLLDCLKAYRSGIQAIVAIMGSRMSEAQEITLVENFEEIFLMFKGDDEGWSSTEDAIRRLATQVFVKAAVLPSGKSAADLTEEELKASVRS